MFACDRRHGDREREQRQRLGHAPDVVGLAIRMTGTHAASGREQAATTAREYACARA